MNSDYVELTRYTDDFAGFVFVVAATAPTTVVR